MSYINYRSDEEVSAIYREFGDNTLQARLDTLRAPQLHINLWLKNFPSPPKQTMPSTGMGLQTIVTA